MRWLRRPWRSATNETPHASCSKRGSYRPCLVGNMRWFPRERWIGWSRSRALRWDDVGPLQVVQHYRSSLGPSEPLPSRGLVVVEMPDLPHGTSEDALVVSDTFAAARDLLRSAEADAARIRADADRYLRQREQEAE